VTPAPNTNDRSHSSRALKGVFWSGINIVVPSTASLLVFVVISRVLTAVDFGVVAAAAAMAAGASALVPSGFGGARVQRMEKDPLALDTVF
jgi:O-antigen/teichoic acid export membrane protein